MLPTDWQRPGAAVLSRISEARVRQYWDAPHTLARRIARDTRAPQPKQQCCVRADVLWDLAAVYPPGVRWDDQLPPAIFFNGPVVKVAPDLERALVHPQ